MPVLINQKTDTHKRKERKVMFLDIDGVCNSEESLQRQYARLGRSQMLGIDPYMAFLVAKIQLDTGCEVVLSSTWRLNEQSRKEVREQVLEFDDVTRDLGGRPRGEEIQEWLDRNPTVDRYAIIDDDMDMLVGQAENFFRTRWKEGITPEIANAVTDHLNGQKRTYCAGCNNPIHIDHFAGVRKGERGDEFYCDALPCLMQLSKELK